MANEMVERVARAMAENAGFCWENCAQSQWRSDALAGIKAMRDPTNAMLAASGLRTGVTLAVWWPMIEAAARDGERQEGVEK